MNTRQHWPEVEIGEVCEAVIDCVNKTAPTVSETTPFRMIRTTNVGGRGGFVQRLALKMICLRVLVPSQPELGGCAVCPCFVDAYVAVDGGRGATAGLVGDYYREPQFYPEAEAERCFRHRSRAQTCAAVPTQLRVPGCAASSRSGRKRHSPFFVAVGGGVCEPGRRLWFRHLLPRR